MSVTFNEAIAPVTGAASFAVTCAAPCTNPTGAVSVSGKVATFSLTPGTTFEPSTLYTVRVTGATSATAGVPMETPFESQFTTGARPTVTATLPVNAATDVVVSNPVIKATFRTPVTALTGTNFTLTCASPCTNPSGSVSLNSAGDMTTFTLASGTSLEPSTVYTATITGAVSQASGFAMASPFVWSFTTQPRPRVTAVAPSHDATGVPVNNTVITAAFTEQMAPLTGAASFTVSCATCATVNPAGSVALDASKKIATFTLGAGVTLEPLKVYTATITAAKSLTSGLTIANPFVWSFTTGVTPDVTRPRVVSTIPLTSTPGPTLDVPVNTLVKAVFTEDMNPGTVTAPGTFTLTCTAPCTSPTGIVTYVVGSRTATFTPDPLADLEPGTTYTATVTSDATDLAGNALAGDITLLPAASDYEWTFKTAAAIPVPAADVDVLSVTPLDAATDVCPSATVNVTFDVPSGFQMDPATVNALTFTLAETLAPANTITASSVVLNGLTGVATFTPQNPLVDGKEYTATIKSGINGVKDLAIPANTMLSDFSWSFTAGPATGACLAPVPLNSATTFGILGGNAGMTNQGINTVINGDIATTAASTLVTGFHDAGPGCTYTEVLATNIGVVNGLIYTAAPPPTVACPTEGTGITAAIAAQARLDAQTAYNSLAGLPGNLAPNDNLSGLTLAPGVYTSNAGSFLIQNGTIDAAGDLTLDAQGDANAVWVFQMATSLTVGGPGAAFPRSVKLINGAQAKNVFWQVGSAATINAAGGGTMVGTIISSAATSFSTPGNVDLVIMNGRALSLNASVTMVNTIINVPAP